MAEKLTKYRVKLDVCPEHVIEAESPDHAIEQYDKLVGILSTIHRHQVSLADAPPTPAAAPKGK